MHKAIDCLSKGLKEECLRVDPDYGGEYAFRLGFLQGWVSRLIEGSTEDKLRARKQLGKMIGRGRCLLNAEDFAKKAKSINLDVSRRTLPEQQL